MESPSIFQNLLLLISRRKQGVPFRNLQDTHRHGPRSVEMTELHYGQRTVVLLWGILIPGLRCSMSTACDSTKSIVIIRKGSCLEVSFLILCIQEKADTVWWQEKQICTYKVWKLFFKKENISALLPPTCPCSINSSWQAETALIAPEMKSKQQALVKNQWHSAKSFIKWIIASTWQSGKCLFSYGFSF